VGGLPLGLVPCERCSRLCCVYVQCMLFCSFVRWLGCALKRGRAICSWAGLDLTSLLRVKAWVCAVDDVCMYMLGVHLGEWKRIGD
jgi:hypothetical protein